MTRELLSEVLAVDIISIDESYEYPNNHKNMVYFKPVGCHVEASVNIHELAFDKCIEWLWKQGFELWSFRANNIFHVRISNKDIKEKRFYSNHDDKYEAIFQACEWILKRRIKDA